MTVRRLITLSDLGSRLLDTATGGSKARGGGDYLSEVLRQRSAALAQAMEQVQAMERADVRDVVGLWATLARHPTTPAEREGLLGPVGRFLGQSVRVQATEHFDALCILALELAAGNSQVTDWLQIKGDRKC